MLYSLLLAIHLSLLFLVLQILRDKPFLLIGVEVLIIASILAFHVLLRRIIRPAQLIRRGLDMIRDEDYSTSLVETGYGDVDELIRVFNGMINKLRKEKLTIREQNHFLDLLISSSPVGLVVTDFELRITSMNPASERILDTKYSVVAGKSMKDLPGIFSGLLNNMKFGEKITLSSGTQKYLVHKDSFIDNGFRRPFYLLEELTSEIRQAEKQAYGKVIRMMAHEVNNTIGAVNSILSSVDSNINELQVEASVELTKILSTALERNNQLNKFMQNYSNLIKLPHPDKAVYELNESLKIVAESLTYILNLHDISLELDLVEPSPHITADRSQIDLVLANLLKNSIEAIGSKGRICVKTKLNPLSLSIQDNGSGISEDVRDRLFTPFFTTKSGGQGIGLTLSREILENHGFQFLLDHSAEKDTEFVIVF